MKSVHTPKARASSSSLPGLGAYSARERDYSGTQDVEFFLDATQAAAWYTWWKSDLKEGGLWFNANWPALRPGFMALQFITEPVFTHVYGGAHRVSATVQVRGASLEVTGDPYWGQVLLLLRGNGTNGATTFIDSSLYNRTMSQSGGVSSISTAQSKFDGSSILGAAGHPAQLTLSTNLSGAEWDADNWTVECWYRRTGSNTYHGLGYFGNVVLMLRTPTNSGTWQLMAGVNGLSVLTCATVIPLNTWTHIAYSCQLVGPKAGGTFTLRAFVNGVLDGSYSVSSNDGGSPNNTLNLQDYSATSVFSLGRTDSAGFNGIGAYLDEYRITGGVARYTADFVPLDRAFPSL
jgi:hypothetical protein